MAFHKIDGDSVDSVTNAVDFFSIPATNVTVSSAKVFEILTSNPLTDTPYHFKIFSSQNYIDLSKCYILMECRIRKEGPAGAIVNLEATDNVAPIQMVGATFMNNIKIAINGREIFNSNSLMAYKTYFSHELSFPAPAKDSHLNAAGYYRDVGGPLEAGAGYNTRRELFALSRTAQFMAKIDADLFNQPQYLISHCELDITITPNESNFMIIAPPVAGQPAIRYLFEVTGLKLYCKKLNLMDGLALQLARKLDQRPARYAVRKTMMKALFISQGRYEFNANLFMDQVPRRITLGLVANADYVGAQGRSPFNFHHCNVREISIQANGRSYPQSPYDLDYGNLMAIRPFLDMNEAVGFANSLDSNGITYAQFLSTHCIYVFNLTNSQEDQAGMFDLIKKGSTAVSIKFRQAVPDGGLMLIVMGEADQLFLVDANRNVASDTTI